MRGHFILIVIGALLCSVLDGVNAKSARLNVTEAAANCPTSGSKSCDFIDPKYWENNTAPANGDDVFIIDADALLELSTPLHLTTLVVWWSNQTNSYVQIVSNSNLTLDSLNSAGFVSIVNGSLAISITADMSDSYLFRGTAFFRDFSTENLVLDNGKFSGGNFWLKNLSVTPLAELRCTSISSSHSLALGGNVLVNSINVTAPGSWQSLVHVWGTLVVDQVTIGDAHMVWIQSSVQVNSFSITGFVVDFIIDSGANFTTNSNLTILGGNVERFRLGGNIAAPNVQIYYTTGAITDDDLIIHGNVDIYATNLDLGGSLSIKGDLSFNGDLSLLIASFAEFPGAIYHPIMHVAGVFDRADFSLGFNMDNFVIPPQNYSRFVRMGARGDISNFNITAPAMTTVDIGTIDISFRTVLPVVTPPNGSDNVIDNLSKVEIALIVVTIILAAIIIGLIVALVKKGSKANYQQIK